VADIYRVPLLLAEQKVVKIIGDVLHMYIPKGMPRLPEWEQLVQRIDSLTEDVHIAVVGKYVEQTDTYLSIVHALRHAAIHAGRRLHIDWVDSELLTLDTDDGRAAWALLKAANGMLVPGGFGERGVEGKIRAVEFARVNKMPFLGVCLGLQIAVIEYARNILGRTAATSAEFDEAAKDPVVIYMPEVSKTVMGGTMRLGSRETLLKDGPSLARSLYGGVSSVSERHRHRYEVNPEVVGPLEQAGLIFSGKDDKGERMEIVELPTSLHPFFFGTQCVSSYDVALKLVARYHPEFQSRVLAPSAPFVGLLLAASGQPLPQ